MTVATKTAVNVRQAVPFFWVRDIDSSLRFYVEGLGFRMTNQWVVDGKVRWCWLEHGDAALMLQEWLPSNVPEENVGRGVSVCFVCTDAIALWRDFSSRGISAKRPFVGNAMWVTEVSDPDITCCSRARLTLLRRRSFQKISNS